MDARQAVSGLFVATTILVASGSATEVPFGTSSLLTGTLDGPLAVEPADIDGDGDTDLVGLTLYDRRTVWWINPGRDGGFWQIQLIQVDSGDCEPHDLAIADVDGDGDDDVIRANRAEADCPELVWFENTSAAGIWPVHTIANDDAVGVRHVEAADIDGDGSLDVVAAASRDDAVTWWESSGGTTPTWTERPVETGFDHARSVDVADIDGDGDGDLDIVAAAPFDNRVAWWENPGWVRHDLLYVLTAVHDVCAADVNRDGWIDLVAAVRGLDRVRIYRESEFLPFLFDPAEDPLVASVDTLSLDADGGMIISMPDGDPNTVLGGDTSIIPAGFYVVITTAADASVQTPNAFRLTHLSENGTAVEDRDHDIPMVLAYRENDTSKTITVSPDVLFHDNFESGDTSAWSSVTE